MGGELCCICSLIMRAKKGLDRHGGMSKNMTSCLDPEFIRQSNQVLHPFFAASCHLYPPSLSRHCSKCTCNYTENVLSDEVGSKQCVKRLITLACNFFVLYPVFTNI